MSDCREQWFFGLFILPLSLLDKADGLGSSLGASAVLDPLAACLGDGLEDLVVPLATPAISIFEQLLRIFKKKKA